MAMASYKIMGLNNVIAVSTLNRGLSDPEPQGTEKYGQKSI